MRLNSLALAVTIVAPLAQAWAAISKSLLPIGVPPASSSERIAPYSASAARALQGEASHVVIALDRLLEVVTLSLPEKSQPYGPADRARLNPELQAVPLGVDDVAVLALLLETESFLQAWCDGFGHQRSGSRPVCVLCRGPTRAQNELASPKSTEVCRIWARRAVPWLSYWNPWAVISKHNFGKCMGSNL